MPVTKQDIDQARQDAKNKRDQEIMEKELSFPEFKDKVSEEAAKAKTKMGEHAAEKSYYSNVLRPLSELSRRQKLDKVISARDEADNEVKRETRGKVPGLKKGGKVSSASSRADGCAQRGKTRGKMV